MGVPLISPSVGNFVTRRRVWAATATMLAAVVAASVGAAVFGWAARGAAPSWSSALPVPSTDLPVPSSAFELPPPEPTVKLAGGLFTSLDVSTDGSAALVDAGGNLVVRLSDFRTDGGRGYVLYLVPAADARTPADGVSLGSLKGARGEQYYPVPVGARVSGPLTVLIWSRGFKGPVAHAVLRH
jgi:hypothetical protein